MSEMHNVDDISVSPFSDVIQISSASILQFLDISPD